MFDRIDKGMYWDKALSLVEGCTPVSAGCAHCWAAQQTYVRSHQANPKIKARYQGLNKDKCTFNGRIRLMDQNLDLPLRNRKPSVWAVWNDFFHPKVPLAFQAEALSLMVKCPQDIFIILTKRHKQLAIFNQVCGWSVKDYPNIWLGVSVEDQKTADERISVLLQVPAAVRVVSIEPMLGAIDIEDYLDCGHETGGPQGWQPDPSIDWVICGGETGLGARPMNPEWARAVNKQCVAAGVPYFHKQNGMWRPELVDEDAPTISFPVYPFDSIANHKRILVAENTADRLNAGSLLVMKHVTKTQAGRLLDEREWNQIPGLSGD